jgi:hypothetical protein
LRSARKLEKVLTVEVVGSAAVACVAWVRGVCSLLRRARQREMRLSMGLIGSSAVACVACVREGCNLLRWARRREERLLMVVIGDGGGDAGDIGGGDGGDGMGAESSGPARNALSMLRPSQLKQELPLSGDWMLHFCTNF